MAQVVLEGITKFFPTSGRAAIARKGSEEKQRFAAVKDLSLEVSDGELLVLVGPSGCGKSTVLRVLAGLETPDRGTVRLGGRVVNQTPPKDRDIALVFQNFALYPHMTAHENMAFGPKLRSGGGRLAQAWRRLAKPAMARRISLERSKIQDRVRQTARTLSIEPLLDRMPGQLSGGERQRVALGRAMVRNPAVLLLDEPLSNLDAQLRAELRRELKELHLRQRSTMIHVTHDQVEALTLGDRIAVMEAGRIQQIGAPDVLYDRPRNRFVAGFLGSPAMNFVEGRLHSGASGIQFEGAGVVVPLSASPLGSSRVASPDKGGRGADAGLLAYLEQLPRENQAALLGRNVVLGVRPKDILLGDFNGDEPSVETSAQASVASTEYLGDALLVHLDVLVHQEVEKGGSDASPARLTCKTAPVAARRGEVVGLRFRRERLHLFDAVTGENLMASSAPPCRA